MRWLIVAVLAAALVSCGRPPAPAPASGGGSGAAPTWLHNLDEALAQAKSSGKPVLVDFSTTW